jgi:hypothetical protein
MSGRATTQPSLAGQAVATGLADSDTDEGAVEILAVAQGSGAGV